MINMERDLLPVAPVSASFAHSLVQNEPYRATASAPIESAKFWAATPKHGNSSMPEIRKAATRCGRRDREETALNRRFGKTAIATLVAWALLLFVAAAPRAHADDRSHCQHAIEKAEARLDKAIHDKGEHSRDAEDRRRDLNAERQRCWDQYHQWWNGHEHRWETEQNWDHH